MTQELSCEQTDLAAVKRGALAAVKALEPDAAGDTSGLRRLEFRLPVVHPLDWLIGQEEATKVYWHNRERSLCVAAVGATDNIIAEHGRSLSQAYQHIMNRLNTESRARYFGGCSFDTTRYHFILPRFEVIRQKEGGLFAINLPTPLTRTAIDEVLSGLENLKFPPDSPEPVELRASSRRDRPTRPQWLEAVEAVLSAIKSGECQKVVLARQSQFMFDKPRQAMELAYGFFARTQRCFDFLFQADGRRIFFGSSPERLFFRTGRRVYSEAIAGTRPRADDKERDARYKHELLNSQKERHEHQLVIDGILGQLERMCSHIEVHTAMQLLRTQGGLHLLTNIEGDLLEETLDIDLLTALHPTPAVGGTPPQAALRYIKKLEPFDRGWYSGPIGFFGKDQTEFAVAIRSALFEDNTLSVFSGAGIVEGADPQAEWKEVENKIKQFLTVLDAHDLKSPEH